jgi:hypothetical protein
VIERCFLGTTSQVGGITLAQIGHDALRRHQAAFGAPESAALDVGGNYRVAKGGKGEFHAYNPQVVGTLHRFLKSGQREEFLKYMETVNKREPVSPRDLLDFKPSGEAVPLAEVESIEEIRRRFTTAGMSLGALSPEAHECLAIAMNSIGGKSNSGEGGEDPARYNNEKCSAIKQVASGRFGVTPADVFANRGLAVHPEVQQLINDLNARSNQFASPRTAAVPQPVSTQAAIPQATAIPQASVPAAVPVPIAPVQTNPPAAVPPSTVPSTVPISPIAPPAPAPLPPSVTNPPLVPISPTR